MKTIRDAARFLCKIASFALCLTLIGASFPPHTVSASADSIVIRRLFDSLGNENTYSWAKNTLGTWSCAPNCPDLDVSTGEQVTLTVEVDNPGQKELFYQFTLQSSTGSRVLQEWGTSSTITWDVSPADYGQNTIITAYVKDGDGVGLGGSDIDDYTYAVYNVVDPGDQPPVLTLVEDSIGNINHNSRNTTNLWGWSCQPNCVRTALLVGEKVTITAYAQDPNNRPLEYQFVAAKQGMPVILQDWGPSNAVTWEATSDYYGSLATIDVNVRNDDGFNHIGDYYGDESTTLPYSVEEPNYPNAVFVQIRDNFGNYTDASVNNNKPYLWACDPNCPHLNLLPNELLTVEVEGKDPQVGLLEYKYVVGSMNNPAVKTQDWSASPYFVYKVDPNEVDNGFQITVYIRNNDNYDYHGEWGDDYAFLQYRVLSNQLYIPILSKSQ